MSNRLVDPYSFSGQTAQIVLQEGVPAANRLDGAKNLRALSGITYAC